MPGGNGVSNTVHSSRSLGLQLNGRIPEIVSTYISQQIYESAFLPSEARAKGKKYIQYCSPCRRRRPTPHRPTCLHRSYASTVTKLNRIIVRLSCIATWKIGRSARAPVRTPHTYAMLTIYMDEGRTPGLPFKSITSQILTFIKSQMLQRF